MFPNSSKKVNASSKYFQQVELINPSVIYYIVYTKYKLNETCKDCAILTFVYRLT